MQKRRLGKEGPEVSCIGFGAWPIGGGMGQVSENVAIEIVRTAIDHGITLLDTAQAYRNKRGDNWESPQRRLSRSLFSGNQSQWQLFPKWHHNRNGKQP